MLLAILSLPKRFEELQKQIEQERERRRDDERKVWDQITADSERVSRLSIMIDSLLDSPAFPDRVDEEELALEDEDGAQPSFRALQ